MAGRSRPNCRTIYILKHTPDAGTVERQKIREGGTTIIKGHLRGPAFKHNLSSKNYQLVGQL
jgi:hypothetical protein